MPTYKVDIRYDMGMTTGGENFTFEADNDEAAKAFLKENKGKDLGPIKRGVTFEARSLCRVVE